MEQIATKIKENLPVQKEAYKKYYGNKAPTPICGTYLQEVAINKFAI